MLQLVRDSLYVNAKQVHRLFTHEDPLYAHKILGLACLTHFGYRTFHLFARGDTLFDRDVAERPKESLLLLVGAHMLLHLTSFQFILPSRRNRVYNIIWPEMRWHSMIFAFRSILMILVLMAERAGIVHDTWANVCRPALVVGTMLSADYVTRHYKALGQVPQADSTMRGNPYPAYIPFFVVRAHNLFYSVSQILATMHVLNSRTMSALFMTLVAIQTAPFGMTLVKKGMLTQAGWHLWYTLSLLVNYAHGLLSTAQAEPESSFISTRAVWALTAVFAVLRFRFRVSKYLLWSSVIVGFFLPTFYFADSKP